MFEPKYRITNYLLDLIEKIAKIQTKIDDSNIQINQVVKLQKLAISKSANASTTIEGNTLTLNQVIKLTENKPVNAEFSQKQEVLNYLQALNWIIKHRDQLIDFDLILKLQAIVCDKLIDPIKLGKLKTKQNYVVNEKGIIIYTPPAPEKTELMLKELLAWLNTSKDRHSIIDSAIFHHQFVSIHPFSDGNGRTARLVAQWILYQREFDSKHIYYLDNYYAEDRRKYYSKIEQTRELDDDFTYWIEYVAQGILSTITEVYEEIKALQIEAKTSITINEKQKALLELIRMNGQLNTQDIQKELNINRARVNQIISPLVRDNIIGILGKGRATKYYLI